MFASLFCCAYLLTLASSLSVCRLTLTERVTCPEDFYCCGVDQCCKLTFANESSPSNKESFNEWLTGFCIRTVIVAAFMVMLYITGLTIKRVKTHYCGRCCPEVINLPRYRPLEKNSIASNLDNISTLIGTPLYHVDSDQAGVLRGNMAVPV